MYIILGTLVATTSPSLQFNGKRNIRLIHRECWLLFESTVYLRTSNQRQLCPRSYLCCGSTPQILRVPFLKAEALHLRYEITLQLAQHGLLHYGFVPNHGTPSRRSLCTYHGQAGEVTGNFPRKREKTPLGIRFEQRSVSHRELTIRLRIWMEVV
jgi:hypothetical protein